MIKLKRAYDKAEKSDGKRFLVERLWPRGIKKTELHVDAWLKDVAPSTALRKWFAHDPQKWREFQQRYFTELERDSDAWGPLLEAAHRGTVTLVFGARDLEHNNAIALKEFLERKAERKKAA